MCGGAPSGGFFLSVHPIAVSIRVEKMFLQPMLVCIGVGSLFFYAVLVHTKVGILSPGVMILHIGVWIMSLDLVVVRTGMVSLCTHPWAQGLETSPSNLCCPSYGCTLY